MPAGLLSPALQREHLLFAAAASLFEAFYRCLVEPPL
jgi:hypothetical protein